MVAVFHEVPPFYLIYINISDRKEFVPLFVNANLLHEMGLTQWKDFSRSYWIKKYLFAEFLVTHQQ